MKHREHREHRFEVTVPLSAVTAFYHRPQSVAVITLSPHPVRGRPGLTEWLSLPLLWKTRCLLAGRRGRRREQGGM